ncbi:hypothetical protein F2Q68_00014213 [Brassica cretica]|uniref:Uncharacterized protein n=1 Tax=Brassica cretica TaxID=69181 RepID=A0A8S9HM00_BRACR|nr:hypothetical protein F2Q68_00014213 [Brassica cretica]
MEDSLELEEWLEDMDQNSKKKLDDDHHTSRGDLETSKASIGRHQPDEIDRQPPHIIDLHPPDIDRHRQPLIDLHHPPNIDRFPLLDVPPGFIIEMEPIEERMYMSKVSHLAVPKHQRPPIWTEEAAEFYKRVKRIHDPVKIVVPCAVFEAESPIPPDISVHLDSYNGILDDQHIEASHRRYHHAVRQVWGKEEEELEEEKKDHGYSQLSLILHFSDGFRKSRVRSRCFSKSLAKQSHCSRDIVASIDTVANKSIDTVANKSIDTVAEHCKRKKIQGRRVDIQQRSTTTGHCRSIEHHECRLIAT